MLFVPATPLLAETSRFHRQPCASGQRQCLARRLAPPARFEPIRTSLVIATGLVAPTPQGASTFDVAATRTTQCRNADDPLAFAAIGDAGVSDSRTNPSTRRPSPHEIRAAALRNKRWAGSFLALAVRCDPRGLFARARGIAVVIASRRSEFWPGSSQILLSRWLVLGCFS
jgi:hypothetical protein